MISNPLFSLSVTAVVVKMAMSEYTLLTRVTLNLNSNYTNCCIMHIITHAQRFT